MDKPNDQEELESEIHTPKVVFNGECEHYWIFAGVDPEGKNQAQCKHCVMGRYFNDDYQVINGEIKEV